MLTINGVPLKKSFIFPGGEVQIQLPLEELGFNWNGEGEDTQPCEFTIKTILNSSDKIMELMLVTNALNHYHPEVPKKLIIHYLPYARQDRICNYGEGNNSLWFNYLLSDEYFQSVEVADVHNESTLYSLEYSSTKLTHITMADIFTRNHEILNGIDLLISPDKGAKDKVSGIAHTWFIDFLCANKDRDTETGKINSIGFADTSNDELAIKIFNKNIMICDDIGDGCGTFVELVKQVLKFNPKSITLYVTHGIFSKGLEILYRNGIDKIITTDSFFERKNFNGQPHEFSVDYYIDKSKFKIIKL